MVQKRHSSPLLFEKGYPLVDSQAQIDKPFALLLSDGNQLMKQEVRSAGYVMLSWRQS